jgi:hypothetical protein
VIDEADRRAPWWRAVWARCAAVLRRGEVAAPEDVAVLAEALGPVLAGAMMAAGRRSQSGAPAATEEGRRGGEKCITVVM